MHTKGHSSVRDIRHGETRGVPQGGRKGGGILELQLEAAVLELLVFGGTEKREWVGVRRIVNISLSTELPISSTSQRILSNGHVDASLGDNTGNTYVELGR